VLAGRTADTLNETASVVRRSVGRSAEVAAELETDQALVVPTDVANPMAVAALFDATQSAYGRLDVLFNNAGVFAPTVPMENISYDEWRAVVDVNLTGSFLCAQHAIRMMKAQSPRGGRIINNGSISAHVPRPMSAPYTATKHAMTGLTRSIALDGRAFDIACSQIDIGNAATDMTDGFAHGVLQANGERLSEERMDVAHVAAAVVMMAELPLAANIPFLTIMATAMPYMGRG
jgi:NAD(P)-dependent dehydrogenase (short-subunit alcohol dehydrogenase family)